MCDAEKLEETGAAGKVGLATSTSLAIPSQHCPVPGTSTAASMYFPKMQKSEHGCKVKEKSEDVQSRRTLKPNHFQCTWR
jgi:hypothetical protein